MWGGLFDGIISRAWAWRLAGLVLVALTIILFLFNLRRTAERAGRVAERIENLERANAIQRQMLAAASRRPRHRDDLVERLRDSGF
jgi:uncharacterized membrane protein